jgi:hypothetical protein
MAVRCPHCAERLGIRAVLQVRPCGHCRLPIPRDEDGALVLLAQASADSILAQSYGPRFWLLSLLGSVLTFGLLAIPVAPLNLIVVVPMQMYILERSNRHYTQHFTFLHHVTSSFFSGLAISGFFAIETIADWSSTLMTWGTLGAGAISLPLVAAAMAVGFELLYLLYAWYSRWHFRRVVADKPPHFLEMSFIFVLVSVLFVPVLSLTLFVLWRS